MELISSEGRGTDWRGLLRLPIFYLAGGLLHGNSSSCQSQPWPCWTQIETYLMTRMPKGRTVGHRPHLKGCWDDLGFLAQHWPHSIEILVSDFSIQLFSRVQLELLGFCGEIFSTFTLLLWGKLLRRQFHISYQMQRNNPNKHWNFTTRS